MARYYEAYGSVRGSCGHQHRTAEAAQDCADRDQRRIAARNSSGSLTRSYSDRSVYLVLDGVREVYYDGPEVSERDEHGIYNP